MIDLNGVNLWGNTAENFGWFFGILLVGLLFKKVLSLWSSRVLFRLVKHYCEGIPVQSFTELLAKPINYFILLVFVYLAFDRLHFPSEWNLVPPSQFGLKMIISRLYHAGAIIMSTWVILRLVDFFSLVLLQKASLTESKADDQIVVFVKEGTKVIIGIFSFFVMLGSVFNANIGSILAGLGIGGLAFALAAKETLENLLGSFTIFMDKPFLLGDYVKVGNVTGHVEKIGFRSTRIRTLEKSYVTVPNKKMVDAETENLSMRTSRRANFTIGLTYSTTGEQIRKIISEIRSLILSNSLAKKDELDVLFTSFGTSALEITIDYYLLTTSNSEFLREKESINFGIMKIISDNGCSVALPSTTVYLQK